MKNRATTSMRRHREARTPVRLWSTWEDVDDLYVELLRALYVSPVNAKAVRATAGRLGTLLRERDPARRAILTESAYAALHEAHGDVQAAIQSRRRVHAMLMRLGRSSGFWIRFPSSSVSDNLNMLAILFARIGDRGLAITTLRRSARYSVRFGTRFEGKRMLSDLLAGRSIE